jgi:hypothetical protein
MQFKSSRNVLFHFRRSGCGGIHRLGQLSDGRCRRASGQFVILNAATQPEAAIKPLHPFNCDVTLNPNGGFGRPDSLRREGDLTFQTLAKFKWLSADTVKSFTTEIFSGSPNLPRSGFAEEL